MTPRSLRPAAVLSAFTVLVWTTRINNIWADDALSLAGQIGRTLLAVVFTVFALVTLAVFVRARRTGSVIPCTRLWVRAFALWTIGVWVVRGGQIALADHGAAFIAVHVALAVVSIGLAVWADAAAGRAVAADDPAGAIAGDQSSPTQTSKGNLAR